MKQALLISNPLKNACGRSLGVILQRLNSIQKLINLRAKILIRQEKISNDSNTQIMHVFEMLIIAKRIATKTK